MAHRQGHTRERRSPPALRRPRVPAGERLVREAGWLTTDHPQARWFCVAGHNADWSEVRLRVVAAPGAEASEIVVAVRPDGHVVPQRGEIELGAEAIRIIATAIRAEQRDARG